MNFVQTGWVDGWVAELIQITISLQVALSFLYTILGAACDHHIKQGNGFAAINENWLVSVSLFSSQIFKIEQNRTTKNSIQECCSHLFFSEQKGLIFKVRQKRRQKLEDSGIFVHSSFGFECK